MIAYNAHTIKRVLRNRAFLFCFFALGFTPSIGGVARVAGDGVVSISAPPPGPDGKDWVALVRAE